MKGEPKDDSSKKEAGLDEQGSESLSGEARWIKDSRSNRILRWFDGEKLTDDYSFLEKGSWVQYRLPPEKAETTIETFTDLEERLYLIKKEIEKTKKEHRDVKEMPNNTPAEEAAKRVGELAEKYDILLEKSDLFLKADESFRRSMKEHELTTKDNRVASPKKKKDTLVGIGLLFLIILMSTVIALVLISPMLLAYSFNPWLAVGVNVFFILVLEIFGFINKRKGMSDTAEGIIILFFTFYKKIIIPFIALALIEATGLENRLLIALFALILTISYFVFYFERRNKKGSKGTGGGSGSGDSENQSGSVRKNKFLNTRL